MDAGLMLYNNLKDVKWSATSLPLDRLVSSYRLPQIVKLNTGESVEGLRDNDYILLHSCRQWTTITAHSLEEGHYVIGPKIEIPVHYGAGQYFHDHHPEVEEFRVVVLCMERTLSSSDVNTAPMCSMVVKST
ncbi:UNVERIFIED_CONTAM: hypothetical protein FKN15_069483 [Acipenser sinensis]